MTLFRPKVPAKQALYQPVSRSSSLHVLGALFHHHVPCSSRCSKLSVQTRIKQRVPQHQGPNLDSDTFDDIFMYTLLAPLCRLSWRRSAWCMGHQAQWKLSKLSSRSRAGTTPAC